MLGRLELTMHEHLGCYLSRQVSLSPHTGIRVTIYSVASYQLVVRWVPELELWPLHHKTFQLSKLDFIHSTDASYTFIPATASRINELPTQVPNSGFWMSKLDLWLLHVLHLKTNVCDCQSDILSSLHETTLDSAGSKSVNKFTSLIMLCHLVVTLCHGCGEFHTTGAMETHAGFVHPRVGEEMN